MGILYAQIIIFSPFRGKQVNGVHVVQAAELVPKQEAFGVRGETALKWMIVTAEKGNLQQVKAVQLLRDVHIHGRRVPGAHVAQVVEEALRQEPCGAKEAMELMSAMVIAQEPNLRQAKAAIHNPACVRLKES